VSGSIKQKRFYRTGTAQSEWFNKRHSENWSAFLGEKRELNKKANFIQPLEAIKLWWVVK